MAFLVEPYAAVQNFVEHDCPAGSANCTVMTLTRIHDVDPPSFSVPLFAFNYSFCCDFEDNMMHCQNFSEPEPEPEGPGFRGAWTWRGFNETTGDYECLDERDFEVSSSEMFRIWL